MRTYRADYIDDIEKMMNSFLLGKSLETWCNEISETFLIQTKQSTPPFSITKFLPLRHIMAEHDYSISVPGKIEKTKYGFLLKINPQKLKSKSYYNFVLAHEVAHTFFYDINDTEPIDISGLPASSKYLEYLCNRLARYLIIPSKSIYADIKALPPIESSLFNLKFINVLLDRYEINISTLLTRIICDEPLWEAAFFRFRYFQETETWKLVENYKPRRFNNIDFFIPPPDKHKANDHPAKYPTAKDNLNSFLRRLHKELLITKRMAVKVSIADVTGEPLNTFFNNYYNTSQILLHCSFDKQSDYLNILFPISPQCLKESDNF